MKRFGGGASSTVGSEQPKSDADQDLKIGKTLTFGQGKNTVGTDEMTSNRQPRAKRDKVRNAIEGYTPKIFSHSPKKKESFVKIQENNES